VCRIISFFALSIAFSPVCSAAEPAEPTETVVRMTVQPMAAPKPALKYQLLPELWEMNPGNPVQGYLMCFMNFNFFHLQAAVEQREKWLEAPLKDLPVEKILDNIRYGATENADFAARLDTPDWQVLLRLKRDGANTVLPDVNEIHDLASVLKLRFRAQAAGRRFDEAISGAKTMLAISRHLGEHPTAVAALVGLVFVDMALDPLEEMIQQPGCPNLYWALSNLPIPLIDLHKAISSDRDIFRLNFALLDETVPMSEAQVEKAIEELTVSRKWDREAAKKNKEFQDRLGALVKNEGGVDAARKRLIESGLASEAVKQFRLTQVILLDEKNKYEMLRDDVLKLTNLPYWQIESTLVESKKKEEDDASTLFAWMATRFDEPTNLVRREQRIALLRCVEALRLYAADHDGKLPAKLDDVPVPVPVDPVTGKSFSYQLDGATAILHGTPPRGKEKDAQYNRRYEITIRK
jgi:hypothetical protein